MIAFRHTLAAGVVLLGASAAPAQALLETGSGAVVADATLALEYDSNLFANATEASDWSLALTPLVRYQQERGVLHLLAEVGGAFGRFQDYGDEDYNDFRSRLQVSYPHREQTNFFWDLAAGVNQQSAGNPDLAARTRVTVAEAGGHLRYEFSEKFGLALRPEWSDHHYRTAGYRDHRLWGCGADLLYLYSEKLDFLLGYRYRDTRFDGSAAPRARDHAVTAGARGDLSPKVAGDLRFGWQWRDSDALYGETDSSLFYSLGLIWSASEKTNVTLTGQRDYDASGASQSIRRTSLRAGLQQSFTDRFSGDLHLGWKDEGYSGGGPGRTDEAWLAGVAARFAFNDNLSASAAWNFESRDSDLAVATYDRQQLSLSVQVSY